MPLPRLRSRVSHHPQGPAAQASSPSQQQVLSCERDSKFSHLEGLLEDKATSGGRVSGPLLFSPLGN